MKNFTKTEISGFKRTAQNVFPYIEKMEKINTKIAALQLEKEDMAKLIENLDHPTKVLTGYNTVDLFEKVQIEVGTDKEGRIIKKNTYVLKYPDTIVPLEEDITTEIPQEVVYED